MMLFSQVPENAYNRCLQVLTLSEHLYNLGTEELLIWASDQAIEKQITHICEMEELKTEAYPGLRTEEEAEA